MNELSGLRKYRFYWVTIPVTVAAVLLLFVDFKPSIAAQVPARFFEEQNALNPRDAAAKRFAEARQAELRRKTAATEERYTGQVRSLHQLAPTYSQFQFRQEGLKDLAAEERPSFLNRIYLDRPYANEENGFDAKMRYDHDYDNPFRHYAPYESERIRENRNNQFKEWSQVAMREQGREVVRDADQESSPIKALRALKGLFGMNDLFSDDKDEKRARSRRSRNDVAVRAEDRPANAKDAEVARVYLDNQDRTRAEEEEIPTKFKSNMNVAKQSGRMELQNPYLIPGAQMDLKAQDRVELKAKKELKSLALDTGFSYGVDKRTVAMNVNKKITEELSCEVKSTRSDNRDIKSEQLMQLNYRIAF